MLLIILIVLILIIIFIVCLRNKPSKFNDTFSLSHEKKILNNQKKYNLYTHLESYRLGDIYNGNAGNELQDLKKTHLKNFPTSIASEYIKQTNNINDINILINIINNKSKNIINNNNCILHLRVGDVLEQYENTFNKILNKLFNNVPTNAEEKFNHNIWYLYDLGYYKEKIEKLKKLNINNIIIIAGSHIKLKNYKHSTYVINKIKELFEKNGIKVELSLGKNPDDDVILVYKSKYFIPSKGGYSRLLTEITQKSRGIII